MSRPIDDTLISRWTRLGAGFNARPAAATPDLERLLLDTARRAPAMPRLFIMAATWLNAYGDLVAKHRLKRLIRDELEPEYHPTLGLLLDIAQAGTHPLEFQAVTRALGPAAPPRPLFDVERESPALIRRASEVSGRWGLWCEPLEFKPDALRPPRWVMAHNPELLTRAYLRGDLRASVLAALRYDSGAGESELALARMAGGSRAQVRSALDNLEMVGEIARTRPAGSRRTRIELLRRREQPAA